MSPARQRQAHLTLTTAVAAAASPPATCRRLVLMRHADSEAASRTRRDHDREITQAGADEARQVRQRRER